MSSRQDALEAVAFMPSARRRIARCRVVAGVAGCLWPLWLGARCVLVASCLILLLLGGCSRQLLGGLDEASANQVLSALRMEGIDADKVPAAEGQWRLDVPDAQMARAVQVMSRRNLPPRRFEGLGEVFRKDSLVSTPTEERARWLHAVSQELERSLREIDGVMVAHVHPVIPLRDPLSTQHAPSSASVLIKHRAGLDVTGLEGIVRALVSAGIEGVGYDDVRVLMVAAQAYPAAADGGGVSTPPWLGSAAPWQQVLILLSVTVLLGVGVLCWREGPRITRALSFIRHKTRISMSAGRGDGV